MTTLVPRSCLALLIVLSHAVWCGLVVASPVRPQVLVVARPEHGPAMTQLFEAVVHARLPEVEVRYVPEGEWKHTPTAAAAPDLVCRLDTSQDHEWRLRLEYRGQAWTRTIEGGLSRDAAAIEAAALMAAHTSVALLTRDSATIARNEPPAALEAWIPVALDASPAEVADSGPSVPAVEHDTATAARANDERSSSTPRRYSFWWLELMGAYRGQTYANESVWTHGAKVALLAHLPRGLCALLGATLVEPTDVDSEFGSFAIRRGQGEALLGWCFRRDRFGLSPRLGALVEVTHRSEVTPAAGVGTSPEQRQLGWAAVTALEARWGAAERLDLVLGVGAAYFLKSQEFVASGVPEPVLAPYRVRFSVDLGLDVGLF